MATLAGPDTRVEVLRWGKNLSCRLFYQAPPRCVNAQGRVALVAVVDGVHFTDGVEVAEDVGGGRGTRAIRNRRSIVGLPA